MKPASEARLMLGLCMGMRIATEGSNLLPHPPSPGSDRRLLQRKRRLGNSRNIHIRFSAFTNCAGSWSVAETGSEAMAVAEAGIAFEEPSLRLQNDNEQELMEKT